jgi:hypothetical protein
MAEPRAGEATTANYGWVKPTVGASADAWGGYVNADLDSIDSTVHGIQASVPAASSTTPVMDGTAAIGSASTYARGDHVHPTDTSRYAASNPSNYVTAAAAASAAPVQSVATRTGAIVLTHNDITDWAANMPAAYVLPTATTTTLGGVKVDGTTIAISGGVISSTGGYTLPTASTTVLGGVKVDGTSITISSGAISAAIPAASSSVPTMNAVGAAGTGTTWSRADHVHPTDTSRAPLASPTFSGTVTIPGVVNASNASAGTVGEFVTATQSTNVAMTTAVAINVTSISLTAGDWDVDGNAFILASAVTTNVVASVGTTSGALAGANSPGRIQLVATGIGQACWPTGRLRVNVSSPTTVYLVAQATFASGTCNAQGTIQARRMR